MSLPLLECFLVLAECQSFTKAAQALYISQPAFSRRILSLETELGVKLFERSRMGQKVQLTPAGEVYYLAARKAIQLLKEAETEARAISNGQTGKLRFGLLKDGQELLVEKAVQRLQKNAPHISVDIGQHTHRELEELLLNGEIDIGFFNSHSSRVRSKVASIKLEESPHCIVVNETHPWAERQSITIPELKDQPLVLVSPKFTPYSDILHDFCQKHNFEPNIIQYGNVVTEVLNYVSFGVGLGFCSGRMALLASPQLRFIPIADAPMIEHLALWRHDNDNPSLPPFLHELEKIIEEHK